MLVCAGSLENFKEAKSIGMGLIQSAISLTRLCLLESPTELIFVGSAGAYDPTLPLLSLYKSAQGYQIEHSFTYAQSYTPLENSLSVQSALLERINLPCVKVNSSNYIHTDTAFAKQMLSAGIALENMEFFAVLSVAQMFNIPSMGVFCLTNYVGPHAHQEFLEHCQQAKTRLSAWMQTFLIGQ
ncbi:purine-nucleoside phosphorylase [Helicobacter baculiformis]|uniref:Purine-nucleoside phosphorylase n=1 Tax=Helicobacter baculiformis TaxID=427351 RepID=A0ABV7ZGA8_9HELI|nr:purine-nucleoside phosphorylase [Helicobacter baculiformis]